MTRSTLRIGLGARILVGVLGGSALGLGAVPAASAAAQGWEMDVRAGQSSFEALPTAVRTANATLSLRHLRGERWFQAAASTPLSSEDLFWGAATVRDRLATSHGRFEVGLDLTGQGHAQRDPATDERGWGVRGEVLPMVSASAGPIVGELRSGGSWYRAEWEDTEWTRNVWASDLRLTASPATSLRVSGEARHLNTEEGGYTFVGVSGGGAWEGVSLNASVGEWVAGLDAGASSTAWSMGASISVGSNTELRGDLRREPVDPLFLSSARTSWGLGVRHRLGGSERPPPRSGPEIRTGESTGTVILRLPLSEASAPPSVAGDFTGWEPVRMDRRGELWRLELSLDSGVYRYAFRTGDGTWFVPEGFPGRRDDGMGGWVAVLVVP